MLVDVVSATAEQGTSAINRNKELGESGVVRQLCDLFPLQVAAFASGTGGFFPLKQLCLGFVLLRGQCH